MTTPTPWRRLVALLCLIGYFTTGSGLGAAFATALAQRDTQHVVRVSSGESEVRIVLHHDNARRERIENHEHGVPARLLTLLAAPGKVQGDHVMTFSSPAKVRCENSSFAPIGLFAAASPTDWPSAEIALPRAIEHSTPCTRPPHASALSSHTLVRSTVFLI